MRALVYRVWELGRGNRQGKTYTKRNFCGRPYLGRTYQEGLLFRQRLIFPEQQVSFHCDGMHCSETVKWPLDFMHRMTASKFLLCASRIVQSKTRKPAWSMERCHGTHSKNIAGCTFPINQTL